MLAEYAGLIPPLEKGGLVAEGDRVGIIDGVTPARLTPPADLPLSGGGMEFV